jgi:hypothetical protein
MLTVNASAQSLSRLDEDNGIPPLVLERKLTALPGPVNYRAKVRGLQKYTAQLAAPLWLDSIGVGRLDYFLYKEQLHSVEFFTENLAESERVLLWLQARFGPCEQVARAPRYYWRGQFVTLSYDRNLLTGVARVRLESIPLQQALEKGLLDERGY